MANKGKATRFRPELVVAIVIMVLTALGLVPLWVPFLEERPGLAWWMGTPLDVVGRWWGVLFGVALLFVAVYSLWLLRRRVAGVLRGLGWLVAEVLHGLGRLLVRPFKWLWALVKRFYLWVLWGLVIRPVREHFGVEAARGAPPLLDVDLAERLPCGGLRALTDDSLALLAEALRRRSRGSRETVVYYPRGVQLDPVAQGVPEAEGRFAAACNELLKGGWISGYGEAKPWPGGGFQVWVLLPTAQIYQVHRLGVEVRAELLRREIREEGRSAPLERNDVSKAAEEGERAEEITELSIVEAWVLDRMLYLYRRLPGRHVRVDAISLKLFAQDMDVQLGSVRQACDALVEAGFLESMEWWGGDEGGELDVVIGRKVKDRTVAQELMSAIRRRMEREGVWQPR